MVWGLNPGPLLFVEHKDFVWGLIASMYMGNIVGLLIVLTCVPVFAAILRIPFSVIAPIILVLCAIGAYTVHNNTFDVVMMLVFGVVGYFMKKANYPLAPLVLAIVLGDKAEVSLRQALLGSQGNLGVFFSNGNYALRQLGIPSVTVAMGRMDDIGMPVGLTFAGSAYDDVALLRYGYAFEQGGPKLRPVPEVD